MTLIQNTLLLLTELLIVDIQPLFQRRPSPMFAAAAAGEDVLDSAVIRQRVQVNKGSSLSAEPTIRSSFPETWMWNHFDGFVRFTYVSFSFICE